MEDHVPLKGILCWVPCSLVEGKGCNGCSALTCAQFHDICDRWVGSQHPGRSPPVQSPCLLKRSIKADPRGSFETVSSLACCSLVSVGMSALQQVWSGQVQAGIPSAYQDQARQEVLETVFVGATAWFHASTILALMGKDGTLIMASSRESRLLMSCKESFDKAKAWHSFAWREWKSQQC